MKQIVALVACLIILAGCNGDTLLIYDGVNRGYLPLAKGNMWEYDETTDFQGRDTTYRRVVELDSPYVFDGISWYHTVDVCPFMDAAVPNGMFCAGYAMSGIRLLMQVDEAGPSRFEPTVLLEFPFIEGKAWTMYDEDTTYLNEQGDTFRQARSSKRYFRRMETVSVPAGIFPRCILVEDSTKYLLKIIYQNGGNFEQATLHHSLEWYAEGVGMVKEIRTISNSSSDGGGYSSTMTDQLRFYDLKPGK